jgi:hypothetical protein
MKPTNKLCVLSSKIENAHWAERTNTNCCGFRETATKRNFVLWLFLNKQNALWHVKICRHDAKFRVVAVKGNDHNGFGLHENITLKDRKRTLLGCPTTIRKPGLKDYGLSKGRKTELCIQASRQALMRRCLEWRRGSDLRILRSLKTCTVQ